MNDCCLSVVESVCNTIRAYTTLLILPIVKAENMKLEVVVGSVKTSQELLREEVEDMKTQIKDLHTFNNPPDTEEGFINFWHDKKWLTLPRASNEKVADPAARVGEYAEKLKAAGLPVTKSNLRQLGFGSRIINEWWNDD